MSDVDQVLHTYQGAASSGFQAAGPARSQISDVNQIVANPPLSDVNQVLPAYQGAASSGTYVAGHTSSQINDINQIVANPPLSDVNQVLPAYQGAASSGFQAAGHAGSQINDVNQIVANPPLSDVNQVLPAYQGAAGPGTYGAGHAGNYPSNAGFVLTGGFLSTSPSNVSRIDHDLGELTEENLVWYDEQGYPHYASGMSDQSNVSNRVFSCQPILTGSSALATVSLSARGFQLEHIGVTPCDMPWLAPIWAGFARDEAHFVSGLVLERSTVFLLCWPGHL